MYKLYEVSYVNASTPEYYCNVVVVSDNPKELLEEFKKDKNNEEIEVEEFKLDGYEIIVNKV